MTKEKKEIIPIDDQNKDESKKKVSKIAAFFKKPTTIIIILLLIAWGATYLFMSTTHKKELANIQDAVYESMIKQDSTWIQQTVKPLTWALRSELLRENMENVNKYQNEFVKLSGFSNLMMINNEGKIWLSSDKKYEESNFSEYYDTDFLKHNSIYLIVDKENDKIKVSAPIMGIDSRLGTLFVIYTIEKNNYLDVMKVK